MKKRPGTWNLESGPRLQEGWNPLGMELGWYPFSQIETPCPHFQM